MGAAPLRQFRSGAPLSGCYLSYKTHMGKDSGEHIDNQKVVGTGPALDRSGDTGGSPE